MAGAGNGVDDEVQIVEQADDGLRVGLWAEGHFNRFDNAANPKECIWKCKKEKKMLFFGDARFEG